MAGKLPILTPLKTCVPEKVGALTPLGVKSGKYNGTSKKRGGGVKSGHFPSHFYYTTSNRQNAIPSQNSITDSNTTISILNILLTKLEIIGNSYQMAWKIFKQKCQYSSIVDINPKVWKNLLKWHTQPESKKKQKCRLSTKNDSYSNMVQKCIISWRFLELNWIQTQDLEYSGDELKRQSPKVPNIINQFFFHKERWKSIKSAPSNQ